MAQFPSGFQFPILDSSGNPTSTIVDMEDMFVRKELFLDAGLWSIGANAYGQLGNSSAGVVLFYASPIQIGSLTTWKQVSAGETFAAAISVKGELWSWGRNQYGQIGNSTIVNYSSPVQIGSLTNWRQISCSNNGSHSVAIKTDGTLWSWGVNTSGQLGNSTIVNYSSPIQIGSLTTWKQVSAGNTFSMAIKNDGTLWWAGSNAAGTYSSLVQMGSLTNWKQIISGNSFIAAIKTDGTLWTWGSNGSGQLGNNTIVNYGSPIQIGSLTNWKQVSLGQFHATAIKTDGTLWAWGWDQYGQLGNSANKVSYSSPIQIGALTNWKYVAGGTVVTSAIKTDGTLWGCGYNYWGEIGTSGSYSSPVQIGSLTTWKQIACGDQAGASSGGFTIAISSPDLP